MEQGAGRNYLTLQEAEDVRLSKRKTKNEKCKSPSGDLGAKGAVE